MYVSFGTTTLLEQVKEFVKNYWYFLVGALVILILLILVLILALRSSDEEEEQRPKIKIEEIAPVYAEEGDTRWWVILLAIIGVLLLLSALTFGGYYAYTNWNVTNATNVTNDTETVFIDEVSEPVPGLPRPVLTRSIPA